MLLRTKSTVMRVKLILVELAIVVKSTTGLLGISAAVASTAPDPVLR